MKAWSTPVYAEDASAKDTFSEITVEQLYDCAALLALSVVQHRAEFGVVPLKQAAAEFADAISGSGSPTLLAEGRQTLEETLKYVKTLAPLTREYRRDGLVQQTELTEKRQQIRINISAPLHVVPSNSTIPLKAKLENISWGGAALAVDQPIGEIGDYIQVILPSFRGRRVMVQGEVVRISEDPDGQTFVVRFVQLRTADETILRQLLEFLARSGDDNGQRENARLARRIDIHYDDANELRATLEDMSTGGMGLTLPEPMDVGQSLLVAISTTGEESELLLRARVVRQQEVFFSELQMYRIGLEFEHPTNDVKKHVSELIRMIATANPAAVI